MPCPPLFWQRKTALCGRSIVISQVGAPDVVHWGLRHILSFDCKPWQFTLR